MAGADRMTIEEVVRKVLLDEHADVIREAVKAVAAEMMELEVSELIGAERGERRPDGSGDASQRLSAAALGHAGGRGRVADPQDPSGQLLPELSGAAPALGAGAAGGGPAGLCVRRLDAARRPAGREPRPADSQSEVSRVCAALDEHVDAFRTRPLEGRYPYVFLDAKVEKVRDGGRVVNKALVIAHGVHETGRREILSIDVGEAETEAFWTGFLRGLVKRGLVGVQLAISDAHAGLKAAIAKVLGCAWQRCTVHFLRDCFGHARKDQHGLLGALIRPIFNADSLAQARDRLSEAVAHLDGRLAKVATMLEDAETDILAFYAFPPSHWRKLRSTNPLERFNKEVGRRTDVVGIFPDDRSLIRLAGMLCIEQNDEWLVGRGYLSAESISLVLADQTITQTRRSRRRCPSSKRPEPPTSSPTSGAPNSYTTSRDLTSAGRW